MAIDPRDAARQVFEGVMAPLVLGGAVAPGHALGARTALRLAAVAADGGVAFDPDLSGRFERARVRRARRLVPVDALPAPDAGDWALAAAVHDLLQAAHPGLDAALRRASAARMLDVALQAIDRVAPPATVRAALGRHTLFARLLDLARTDTEVRWWTGSATFRGVEPPARLGAWPELRRVTVTRTRVGLLALAPLAVERDRLVEAIDRVVTRSPLTDLATCDRAAPAFAWSDASLALVATDPGRKLALRALALGPERAVDDALDRATRALVERRQGASGPALALLEGRATARAALAPPALSPRSPGS